MEVPRLIPVTGNICYLCSNSRGLFLSSPISVFSLFLSLRGGRYWKHTERAITSRFAEPAAACI